ncbi:hypothetical protein PHBOTO_005621 [Pseudozyma hubeiensis]|nr:hypothetical protein PHBOTO_005621 [Pseudozyma hubeiensis]
MRSTHSPRLCSLRLCVPSGPCDPILFLSPANLR